MITILKRKTGIFLLTFLFLFLVEASLYWFIYDMFFAKEFILELGLFFILLSLIFIFPKDYLSLGYGIILAVLFSALYLVNITLDYCSNDIFSFEYLTFAGEATSIFSAQYIHFGRVALWLLYVSIYSVGLVLLFHFTKKEEIHTRYIPKGLLITLGIFACGVACVSGSLVHVHNISSESTLYENMSAYDVIKYSSRNLKKSAFKNYGLAGYSIGELAGIYGSLPEIPMEEPEEPNEIPGTNEIIYDDLEVTEDYFALCENMNVIEIMIETGCSFAINEYLTPNLYQLRKDGIEFTKNASKNKTNISEAIGIAGSVNVNITETNFKNPYSLPIVLGNKGYTTNYFHNNNGDFYNREKTLSNFGFENLYFSHDINPEREWEFYNGAYPLDSDTMTDILDRIAPADSEKPYYSFYTTLVTHGPYTDYYDDTNMYKYREMGYVDKLKEAQELGLWENICSDDDIKVQKQIEYFEYDMMNLDEAIGILLKHLKDTNQLENTLLVLYGDHDPYYMIQIDQPLKTYIYNTTEESTPYQYETFMTFYNPKLSKTYERIHGDTVYTDFTSPYVIAPTVLELLGVHYMKKNYVGTSIFQTIIPYENMFYSHELAALFNDVSYSLDACESFEYLSISDEENIKALQLAGQKMLRRISVFNNYYSSNSFPE